MMPHALALASCAGSMIADRHAVAAQHANKLLKQRTSSAPLSPKRRQRPVPPSGL
jgi:hypothetical protein